MNLVFQRVTCNRILNILKKHSLLIEDKDASLLKKLKDLFMSPKKFTAKTIVDPRKLEKHLNEIWENGFAFCDEELKKGVKTITVPIKNIYGKVFASIVIVVLSDRMSSKNIEKLLKVLVSSAQQLSKMLGYKEWNIL